MLVATNVVAQDLSSHVITDDITQKYYHDKDYHFSFMGISFFQSIHEFKSGLKNKGWKENNELIRYFSKSKPGVLYYDGIFIGESASAIVTTRNSDYVCEIQVTINYNDKELLQSKEKNIINTIKEKYKCIENINANLNGNEDYRYGIYNDDNVLIGFISLSIIEYDKDLDVNYGLCIYYGDYWNTKCAIEIQKNDI